MLLDDDLVHGSRMANTANVGLVLSPLPCCHWEDGGGQGMEQM